MLKPFRLLLLLAAVSLAQGCGWFSSDEEIEPAQLQPIEAEHQVKTIWSSSAPGSLGEKIHSLRPAMLGDRVYVADIKGGLYAISQDDGKTIWNQDLETSILGGVGVGDGKVMLTTMDGRLLVRSALDGEPLWETFLGAEAVVPAQANADMVLVQTIDGRLRALSPSDGSLLWSYKADIPALTLRGSSTPVLLRQAIFAGFANGKMVAIDPASGNVAWEARVALPQGKTELERVIDVDGELVLDTGIIYATSYQGRLVAISGSNGRILWNKDFSSYRSVANAVNQIVAIDDQGNVVSFDKSNGLELWRQEGLFYRQPTNAVYFNNLIAVADFKGYVHFLSPTDGRFVARTQVDSNGINGPLMVVDDRLYVYGNSGRLSVLTVE